MLHRLRGLGLSVRVYERADGVGGTWYWNRYPGARCDTESMIYSYSFSSDLEQEWAWTERDAAQAEILEYANHVADRFDLRRDIRFETNVTAVTYDEDAWRWIVETDRGEIAATRFCISAVGCLSAAALPEYEGLADFEGAWYHTGHWPHERVDFTGKRVGIVGTGSSGVQSTIAIAREAAHLFVFQRTRKAAKAVPAGEREREYEAAWAEGGFNFVMAYPDILTDLESYDLDAIVFATGFDAITGPLLKMNIRGKGGKPLQEKWAEGPRSYLGVSMVGFPNLFMITGPGSPCVLSNMLVSIEQHVDWIANCIEFVEKKGFGTIEAMPEAEDAWVRTVHDVGHTTLYPLTNSWYTGTNITGKVRMFTPYAGGVGTYRRICDAVVDKGYEGFEFRTV